MNINKNGVNVSISGSGKISLNVNGEIANSNKGNKQNKDNNLGKKKKKKENKEKDKTKFRFQNIAPNNPKDKDNVATAQLSARDNFGNVMEDGKIKPNPNSKMNRHKQQMAERGANAEAVAEKFNMGGFINSSGKLEFRGKRY